MTRYFASVECSSIPALCEEILLKNSYQYLPRIHTSPLNLSRFLLRYNKTSRFLGRYSEYCNTGKQLEFVRQMHFELKRISREFQSERLGR